MRAKYRPLTAALLSLTILSQSTVGFALAQEPVAPTSKGRLEPRLTPDEALSNLKTELEKFVTWSSPERDTLIRIESKSDMLLPTRFTYEVELATRIPFLLVHDGTSLVTAQPLGLTAEELNKPQREMLLSVAQRFEGLAVALKSASRIKQGRDQFVAETGGAFLRQGGIGLALAVATVILLVAGARSQSHRSALLLGTTAAFITGWSFIHFVGAKRRAQAGGLVDLEQTVMRRVSEEFRADGREDEATGLDQAILMAEESRFLWSEGYDVIASSEPFVDHLDRLMPLVMGFMMAGAVLFGKLSTGLTGKQRALGSVIAMLPAAFFFAFEALDTGQTKALVLDGLEHPDLVLADSERQMREILDRLFERGQIR